MADRNVRPTHRGAALRSDSLRSSDVMVTITRHEYARLRVRQAAPPGFQALAPALDLSPLRIRDLGRCLPLTGHTPVCRGELGERRGRPGGYDRQWGGDR